MTVKMFLAILLFTGMGVIIIGGVYVIGEQHRVGKSNVIKPIDRETENNYDLLERECDNNSCCLASLKIARGIYKEIKKDGNCPDGFGISSFSCPKTLDWCEPIEKLNIIGNYVNAITSMCSQNCDRYYIGSYELVNKLKDVDGNDEKEVIFATGDMVEAEELPTIAGPDSDLNVNESEVEAIKFKIDNYQKIDFPKISISEKELVNYLVNKNAEFDLEFENPIDRELKFKIRIDDFEERNDFQNVILNPNETKVIQYVYKSDDYLVDKRKRSDSLSLVVINDFADEKNYQKYYRNEANSLDSKGIMIYVDKFIKLEDRKKIVKNTADENSAKCISVDCAIENCIAKQGAKCSSEEKDYVSTLKLKVEKLQLKYPNFVCNWDCNKAQDDNYCELFCIKKIKFID